MGLGVFSGVAALRWLLMISLLLLQGFPWGVDAFMLDPCLLEPRVSHSLVDAPALLELKLSRKEPVTENAIGQKYNDLAFGLVSLGSLAVTQNVDFVGSFVGVSAVVATLANQDILTLGRRLLPAVTAGLTAVVFPLVASLHQTGSLVALADTVASSPVEFGLLAVSILIAFVDFQTNKE